MKNISRSSLIYLFLAAKLLVHLLTMSNYGLHRDEYLYLEEGRHLAWGFMEVPPMTPFVGFLAQLIGDNTFAVRILPVLCGLWMMYLVFRIITNLGGDKTAISIAGIAFLVAPAFLRSHGFLMPVVLEQLVWTLLSYQILRIVTSGQRRWWYAFGLTLGLAWLTKYAVLFFGIAVLLAVFLTPHRQLLRTKEPYLAFLIALIVASPNIFWQYQHNFPVLAHMEDLAATQLTNVNPLRFLTDQLMMFGTASIIWLVGLFGLLFRQEMYRYRLFAYLGGGVILLFLLMSGKSYYTLGIYPMLLSFGAVQWEKFELSRGVYTALGAFMILFNLPIIPFGAPVLPLPQMKNYCAFLSEKIGFNDMLYWEDGELHELPQDFADMTGWEELPEKVARFYHSLPQQERENTIILGGHYGQAGVLNLRRSQYNLPEVQSFNSSYRIWQRTDTPFRNMILVDDRFSMESDWFNKVVLVDSIADDNARDPGYIFYRSEPKIDVNKEYIRLVEEWRKEFNFAE